MSDSPVSICVVSLICGMSASYLATEFIQPDLSVLLVALVLFFIALIFLRKKETKKSFVFATCLFCFFLGATLFQFKTEKAKSSFPSSANAFKGIIKSSPQQKKKTVAVELKLTDGVSVLAYLQPKGEMPPLHIGDTIIGFSRMGFERTYDNPKDISPSESALVSYRKWLLHRGICATCYVDNNNWKSVANESHSFSLSDFHSLQEKMCEIYRENGLGDNENDIEEGKNDFGNNGTAIIEAMTTGNRGMLTKEMRDNFSKSGVSHILALSGFHLSIIYACLQILMMIWLLPIVWKRWLRLLTLLCIWAFALIAGLPASLVRASIMISIMIIADLLGRNSKPINSLSLAALLMLVWNPFSLLDVGFQLSFLSMLGLSTVGQRAFGASSKLYRHNIYINKVWGLRQLLTFIIGMTITTIVCSLFTFPAVAYYFGTIPVAGLLSNLVISLMATLLIWCSVIWWVLFPILPVRTFVGNIMSYIASTMDGFTAYVASLEWSTINWKPNFISVLLCYLLLFVLMKLSYVMLKSK